MKDLYDFKTLSVLFLIGLVSMFPALLKRKRIYEWKVWFYPTSLIEGKLPNQMTRSMNYSGSCTMMMVSTPFYILSCRLRIISMFYVLSSRLRIICMFCSWGNHLFSSVLWLVCWKGMRKYHSYAFFLYLHPGIVHLNP